MAVNKNFVVKNGLEVDTNLIVANGDTNRVGIGTSVPQYTLHVFEGTGIGATDVFVTGITTVINELRVGTGGTIFSVIAGPTGTGQSVGVGTATPTFLLDVHSPVSTGQTALRVRGDGRITGNLVIEGDLTVDDITFDDATLSNLTVTEALFVGSSPGISTFVGFTTFQDYVFIQDGLNVTGTGATLSTLNVTGVSTFVGFSTFNDYVFIQDGFNVTGTGATLSSLNVTGVSTFVGIVTNQSTIFGTQLSVSGVSTLGVTTTTNLTAQQLNVSGIATIGNVNIFSGIISALTGNVVYFGDGSQLTGVTASGAGISTQWVTNSVGIHTFSNVGFGTTNPTHPITAKGTASLENLTVSGISSVGSSITMYSSSGIISATAFYGDGTNLTNTGSTLSASSGTQRVVLTSLTSGTMTSSSTDGDLTFDASTNTLTVPTAVVGSAVTINSSGINVSGVSTLGNIQISSGIITTTASSFELYKPVLFNYSEKVNVIGNTGSSCDVNLANGTYVTATLNQSTTFTFTTGITTGAIGFALQLTNGSGGPYSITWPATVYYPNNTTPTRTTTDSKTDIWVFTSTDNGTKWYGNLALYNFS